jgi:hypothetical protein
MMDPLREAERLPGSDAPQGIDRWAQHGVEELAERDAEDRAEMGESLADVHRHRVDGGTGHSTGGL